MSSNIEAFRNYVIFTFVENIYDGRFVNQTSGQIVLTSGDLAQTTYPRWGKTTNVGPDVVGISVGDYVLIEPGKWTAHFHVDGKQYWKTDDEKVIVVSDEPGTTY